MLWGFVSLATIIWPLILLACGIERPGLFAVIAPVLVVALLIFGIPLLLLDCPKQMRRQQGRPFLAFA
jgi:hypothetical protein